MIRPSPASGIGQCFREASDLSGLPAKLLMAIAKVESSMHPYAVSVHTDRRIDGMIRTLGIKYRKNKGFRARYLYSLYPSREQIPKVRKILRYAKEYSLGLMQISSTNRKLLRSLGIKDHLLLLKNPCLNIKVGTLILLECIRIFGDLDRSLTCYNAGVRSAKRGARTPYIRKVLTELKTGPKIVFLSD